MSAVIGATAREVSMGERDGADVRVIRITRTYDTHIDDLWTCFADPERLPRWFLPVSGDLRVGGRFQIEGHAGGEIVACERPEHLSLTWESMDEVSWLEVRLTPVGDETRLDLTHTVPVGPHWEEFGPGAVGIGWDLLLLGLGLHLASNGVAVDPAEFATWSASDDGRTFVVQAGQDWCRVQIAAGAPPAKAEAMAARTIAAYTGGDPG